MNVSIFGLGYVGAVTAGCLGSCGHKIVGVDVSPGKVADLSRGIPPIIEPGLAERLASSLKAGRLSATTDATAAIAATDISLVCVGTPSTVGGGLDLGFVREVAREIAQAVRAKSTPHILIFRSTMLPGSTREISALFASDLLASGKLTVCYYPEFLREGTAVRDFDEPSLSAIGTTDGKNPPQAVLDLCGPGTRVVNWESAELLKYACNAFHATKVAFGNEIGRLGKSLGVDSAAVMSLLCQDTRLNISSYYLRPGNPFGGSCLPKDVRALVHRARQAGTSVPLLESLLPSNERHLNSLLQIIAESNHREIVILGLSFKSNTDDLRESPMVEVAQHCLGRGYTVRIYDPQLNLSALQGANKRAIDTRMPHLADLLRPTLASALGERGLVIASQKCAPLAELSPLVGSHHSILDVNGWEELKSLSAPYQGLCW